MEPKANQTRSREQKRFIHNKEIWRMALIDEGSLNPNKEKLLWAQQLQLEQEDACFSYSSVFSTIFILYSTLHLMI